MTARKASALFAGGTAGAGVRHLPSIAKDVGSGWATTEWRMTCTCGQTGAARATRRMASADWDEHLSRVSDVPPAERCQMPKAHRLQPWERCALCAGQLDLFDLGEAL